MGVYAIKRVLLFIPTLLLMSILIFALLRILPGDPAEIMMGEEGARFSEDDLKQIRAEIGTDKPLHIQYVVWIANIFQGDFGKSFYYRVPVSNDLKLRFPTTMELAILASIIGVVVAVPLGVLSAVKQDTWIDHVVKIFSIGGIAMPNFFVGVLIVLGLAEIFEWSPPIIYSHIWEDPVVNLQQMIFPALALGYGHMAFIARVTRSSMLEVMREDYIRTARSKGLAEYLVIFRHAVKNAFLPVVTVSGYQFARTIGGTVVIETIFLVPGIGNFLVISVLHRDFNAIQATFLIIAVFVVVVNLFVDLLYGWLNPRVRYA